MSLNLPDGGQIRERASQMHAELAAAIAGCVPREGDWYQDLLCGLATEAGMSAIQMMDADNKGEFNRSAWGARNLLELCYWVPYVLASRDKARRFVEDALCDYVDLFRTIGKYPGTEPLMKLAEKSFAEVQQHRQVTTDADKILSVAKVAKEMGEEFQFNVSNKFLSKLVHITSLSVKLRFETSGMRDVLAVAVVQSGAQCMDRIFPLLTEALKGLHPKT